MTYRPITVPLILVNASLSASAASAQNVSTTWTICDRDLKLTETIVTRANESQIVTVDEFGIRRSRSVDNLFFAIPTSGLALAIEEELFSVAPEESDPTKYITLADGQIIKGAIMDSPDSDKMRYTAYSGSIIRGQASIPLERLLWISDQPNIDPSALNTDSDSIKTMNGDVLLGFIESVGPVTTISSDRDELEVRLGQIRSMGFANLPEPVEGMYLSTSDHLNLRVSSFDFDFQHPLTLTVDARSLGLDSESRAVWLLDPDAPVGVHVVRASERILSLTEIVPELVEPTGDRSWTPFPTVLVSSADPILSSIDLHAPVRAVYRVPEGASRFACELVAPINTWTDCLASVYSISYSGERTQLLYQRLDTNHPVESLNTELEPDTEMIEIRIDPGENGPIQDRVLIKHPRLLIGS
jgi:hypothetical protein